MATNGKVFVSPGVYTSEVDLSFVAQSVGVTTRSKPSATDLNSTTEHVN